MRPGPFRAAVVSQPKKPTAYPSPSLDLSFMTPGVLDPRIAFSRASIGTYFDSSGVLQVAAVNSIRNSMAGGAAGATPPTFWQAGSSANGITYTGIGPSIDAQGFPAYDVNLSGTSALVSNFVGGLVPEAPTFIAALTGQTWTFACNLQLISGTLNGLTIGIDIAERTSGGALVVQHMVNASPTTTMTRFASSAIFSGGGTVAFAAPLTRWNLPAGATINCTIRISQPQCEMSAAPTAWVPTTNAASGGLRFDYDPIAKTLRGLLIEESRQNQVFPSVNGAPGAWSVTGEGTSTPNIVTAPDGTLTGSRLVAGAVSNIHGFGFSTPTPGASIAYTLSVFAKAGASSKVSVDLRVATNWVGSVVQVGTFDLAAGIATPSGSGVTCTITPVGNGWYRCTVTATSAASGLTAGTVWIKVLNAAGLETYTGAGESAYFWGLQYEQGTIPTSYVPTTSAAATRAADVATMPLAPPAAFSLAAEFMVPVIGPTLQHGVAVVDDGTTANRISTRVLNSNALLGSAAVVAGSALAQPTVSHAGVNTVAKLAYASNGGAPALSFAGNGVTTTAAVAQPTGLTTLRFGVNLLSGNWLNGWIRRVTYWSRSLSSAELADVTFSQTVPSARTTFAGSVPAPWVFSRTSTAYWWDASENLVQVAAGVPRFRWDPATNSWGGLLIERQSTNWIRNPRGEAAAGATPPTFWTPSNVGVTGATYTWSRITEKGMPVTLLRFQGTASAANLLAIDLEAAGTAAVPLATNAWYCQSIYARMHAGTWPAGMTMEWEGAFYDAAGAFLSWAPGLKFGPFKYPSDPLRACRGVQTDKIVPANVAFFRPRFTLRWENGGATDFTIAIACPQVERPSGNSQAPTSPMLPVAGTPGTSTRSAPDVCYGLLNGGADPSSGAIVVRQRTPFRPPAGGDLATQLGFGLNNGSGLNSLQFFAPPDASHFWIMRGQTLVGGGDSGPTPRNSAPVVCGISWDQRQTNTIYWAQNGVSAGVNPCPDMTVPMTHISICEPWLPVSAPYSTCQIPLILEDIAYWPRGMSKVNLVAATKYREPTLKVSFVGITTLPAPWVYTGGPCTYFDQAGMFIEVPTSTPRWTWDSARGSYVGIFGEPVSTNMIQNPRGEGAAGATPPTRWTDTAAGGTSTYTRTTIDGFPAVSIRCQGSNAAAGTHSFAFEPSGTSAPAIVTGKNYTKSVYLRLDAGTLPAGTQARWEGAYFDAAGAFVANDPGSVVAMGPSAATPLRQCRVVHTVNLATAGVAFFQPKLTFSLPAGAYDFTVVIACPQLENDALCETTVILPPVGTPGAATRTEQKLSRSIPLEVWDPDQNEGTLYQHATIGRQFTAGLAASRVSLRTPLNTTAGSFQLLLFADGRAQMLTRDETGVGRTIEAALGSGITPGTVKMAGSWSLAGGMQKAALNGSLSANGGPPLSPGLMWSDFANTQFTNNASWAVASTVHAYCYYPFGMTDKEMRDLTSTPGSFATTPLSGF